MNDATAQEAMFQPQQTQLTIQTDGCTLGSGYKSWLFGPLNNTALDSTTLGSTTISGTKITFTTTIATGVQDLSVSVGATAQAQGAVLGADVGGSAKLMAGLTVKNNQTFIVGSVEVRLAETILTQPEVAGAAGQLSVPAFLAQYGDYYASTLLTGGRLTLLVTATFSSVEAKVQFDAGLTAKVPEVGSGQADMKTAFDDLSQASNLTIAYACAGGTGPTGTITNPTVALNYLLNFPGTVTQTTAVQFGAVLSRYGEAPGGPVGTPTLVQYMAQPLKNLLGLSITVQEYQALISRCQTDLAIAQSTHMSQSLIQKLKNELTSIGNDIKTIQGAWSNEDPTEIPSTTQLQSGSNAITPVSGYNTELDNIEANFQLVVNYAMPFHLQWKSTNLYVGPAAGLLDYVTLSPAAKVALVLASPTSKQGLNYGDTVYVENYQQPNPTRLSGVSGVRALEFNAPLTGSPAQTQQWILVKQGDSHGTGQVKFQDSVYLVSVYWANQRVTRHDDDTWLSTVLQADDTADSCWTIVAAAP